MTGVACWTIKPGTEHDVLPIRCRLDWGHDGVHEHPPIWPGTPPLVWHDRERRLV